METLRINSSFEKKAFIKAHSIKWEIHWLKNRKHIIGNSIASLILITLGIIASLDEDTTNPFIVIGFVFAFIALFLFYVRIFSKRKYKRTIDEIAEKYDTIKLECTYEFSEESIKYWDNEKKIEFNWSVFKYYSIYKGYLVIALNNSLIESYLFEKNETEGDEYEKLLEFVESKLEYREIK